MLILLILIQGIMKISSILAGESIKFHKIPKENGMDILLKLCMRKKIAFET